MVRPVGAAEKSVVLVPDVPAQDAPSHLRELLQRWRAEPVSRAPYIPDAVRSVARSSSVAAPWVVRAQPVLRAGRSWSGRLIETSGAEEASLPELRESSSRQAQRVPPLPVAGPLEPSKQQAVLERRTAVELVAAEL